MKKIFSSFFGIGMLLIGIGFALPMIDFGLFGSINGFKLANTFGKFNQLLQYVLYGIFIFACVGGILSFIQKTKAVSIISFIIVIAGFIFTAFELGANKVNVSKIPNFVTNFALDMLAPGAIILAIGVVVSIIGFIFSLGKK